MAVAFTVDEDDDARYKSKNFLKIVPERLRQKSYDTLILQAGCNEISNIQLENSNSPHNVKLWEEKVEKSRLKLFKLAESSIKANPSLKKVIIVKSLPRYDPREKDPSSIKSRLNKFGNSLYDSLWMNNGCPANIQIRDQHLDCQGPLREKRFGSPGYVGQYGKPWDGIHMRGHMAVRHYSHSLIRILNELNHQSCPQTVYQYQYTQPGRVDQFQYQNRRYRNNRYHGNERKPQQTYKNGENNAQYYASNAGVFNRFSALGNA